MVQWGKVFILTLPKIPFERYVKFSDTKAGLKKIVAGYFSRRHAWSGIEKSEEKKLLPKKVQHLHQLIEPNFN